MGDRSRIEWTDATWNPVRGCSRVSEGCRHCYAEQVAARFSGPGMPYEGLAKRVGGEARWTGVVRLVPEHLGDPLRWKRPRRVFVNSMSDLFHEGLSFEEIAAVFAVMALVPRHTFQVLTKRPQRARDFLDWIERHPFLDGTPGVGGPYFALYEATCTTPAHLPGLEAAEGDDGDCIVRALNGDRGFQWPLPNVWLGVSVENQVAADERIPLLLQTPAAVRFVSYEPALGPVDFRMPPGIQLLINGQPAGAPAPSDDALNALCRVAGVPEVERRPRLDWIIVGGESGRGARPFDVRWAESTIEQCRTAGVSCFVKQLGAAPFKADVGELRGNYIAGGIRDGGAYITDPKGGDWNEWPKSLRVREYPGGREQAAP